MRERRRQPQPQPQPQPPPGAAAQGGQDAGRAGAAAGMRRRCWGPAALLPLPLLLLPGLCSPLAAKGR